jgi:pyruvate,water dikinase
LTEVAREDLASVGGKGANLGELLHAGIPVPPGFVVTTDAYAQAVASSAAAISAELSRLNVNDTAALQAASDRLRKRIEAIELPTALQSALLAAYHDLEPGNAVVAVRSSATAEDTPEFSFAGMFETLLNVQGEDRLIAAVRRCWASTFGARVLFYRVTRGLPPNLPVAVVVQRIERDLAVLDLSTESSRKVISME